MLGGLQRDRFAERDDPAAVDLGEREAGVGPADVGDRDLPHACSASIAASIADAPGLGVARRAAASSRTARGRCRPAAAANWPAGATARSTPTASSVPAVAHRAGSCRRRAPGRADRRASASGETWIAAGTLPLAPDMRPSVISATLCPRSCRTPSAGVSLCSSGMPLARGPWKRTTTAHVAVELAGLERLEHFVLVGEAARRRLDQPALLVDRAGLEDGAAEIALHQAHAAVGQEGVGRRPQHVDVGAFLGAASRRARRRAARDCRSRRPSNSRRRSACRCGAGLRATSV